MNRAGLYCEGCTTTERKECRVCKRKAIPFFKESTICINCEGQEHTKKDKPKDWKAYIGGRKEQEEDDQQRIVQQNIKDIKEKYERFKPERGSLGGSPYGGTKGRETFDQGHPPVQLQNELLK